jgi:hypothetical protein
VNSGNDGQRRVEQQRKQRNKLITARTDKSNKRPTQDIKATKYKNFSELNLQESIILALT